MKSLPSPPYRMSTKEPPSRLPIADDKGSSPGPPFITSLSPRPSIQSLFLLPASVSEPLVPMRVSGPGPPKEQTSRERADARMAFKKEAVWSVDQHHVV